MLRQERKHRVVRECWIQNEEKNQWGPLAVRRENRSDFWYVLFISSLQASGEFPAGGTLYSFDRKLQGCALLYKKLSKIISNSHLLSEMS